MVFKNSFERLRLTHESLLEEYEPVVLANIDFEYPEKTIISNLPAVFIVSKIWRQEVIH